MRERPPLSVFLIFCELVAIEGQAPGVALRDKNTLRAMGPESDRAAAGVRRLFAGPTPAEPVCGMFAMRRPCPPGLCPSAEGLIDPCSCPEPIADLDVDELTEAELEHFATSGTPEQRREIALWLAGDPEGELLAGQRDAIA